MKAWGLTTAWCVRRRVYVQVLISLVVILLVWAYRSGAQSGGQAAEVVKSVASGQINWTTGLVSSRARGDSEQAGGHEVSPRLEAFTAAQRLAQQRLFETIRQLPLDAAQTVGHFLQGAADKQRALEALAAEAEVVETHYLPRGVVETVLQLPLSGRFTALVWSAHPTVTAPVSDRTEAVYTGLVIDARGLAIRHALFPHIVDEDGRTIYAPTQVDPEVAAQRGYVMYTRTLQSPQITSRVGEHPLVLRAQRVAGPSRIDLLLRRADATRLQEESTIRTLLRQCRIVIVG